MNATETYLSRPWLAHYGKGVPATVEVPLKSVPQAFDEATEKSPDNPAVVFYGRSITYRELRDATDRWPTPWRACESGRLPRRTVPAHSPHFIIAYFAALKCGATVTPISPVYTATKYAIRSRTSGHASRSPGNPVRKVVKSGVKLDFAVVTSVGEYLPAENACSRRDRRPWRRPLRRTC